jgi:hypothetical protein
MPKSIISFSKTVKKKKKEHDKTENKFSINIVFSSLLLENPPE